MEIGGYFGLEQLISNEYYKDLIPLNTARNALLYILRARKIKKLYIPYYLCDSVSKLCDREGYRYEYYSIKEDFTPDFDQTIADDEYIYIVNYYGQISNEQLLRFKAKYIRIITDNVQDFFQEPVKGIDTIYSCRKFFGVPDGAYLSTDCLLNEELETDVSMGRMKHLLGRFEIGNAANYYEDFKRNDESFANLPLRYMSKITHNILGAIDYKNVKETREQNFLYLHEHLSSKNKLRVDCSVGAFAYPFYCENGMAIKKKLSEQKIYIPTLWPNVLDSQDLIAKDYAENILPLPCDQRYGFFELQRIIRFFGDLDSKGG